MDEKRRRKEERRKKEKEKQRQRSKQLQRQIEARKMRDWRERRRRRRKRDCNLGMPFIIAFQGDPAQLYYCADYPTSYELIPRTNNYPSKFYKPFERLKRYMKHHVTSMYKKILVYKAGRRDWKSRFGLKKSFMLAWSLLTIAAVVVVHGMLNFALKSQSLGMFVMTLMAIAVSLCGCLLATLWKFYNED